VLQLVVVSMGVVPLETAAGVVPLEVIHFGTLEKVHQCVVQEHKQCAEAGQKLSTTYCCCVKGCETCRYIARARVTRRKVWYISGSSHRGGMR